MKVSRSWRRFSMAAALSIVVSVVAVSCGASDTEPSADAGGMAPTNGSGGFSGVSSTSGATSSTGDTGGAEALGGASGASSDACNGTPRYEASWTDASSEGPSARLSHAMADSPGGVVLFGGGTLLLGGLDDTWVWTRGRWRESETDTRPPRRAGHDMVFGEGGVVLFGGDGGDLLNDLWRYADDSWEQLCDDESCGTAPTPRSGLALSFDPVRHKLVLFGGFDGDAALQDTWEWDPDSGWQQTCSNDCATGSCCEPPPRHDHRMTYDSLKQRVLMFGGTNDDSEFDDLWAYDADGWHELEASGPAPRAGHTFAFDPARGLALLFGGTQGGGAVSDDGWVFDSLDDTWTPLETTGPRPEAREFAALAFNRDTNQFVMFGGGDSGQHEDTWTMSYELAGCLGSGGAAGAAGAASDPDPGNPGN